MTYKYNVLRTFPTRGSRNNYADGAMTSLTVHSNMLMQSVMQVVNAAVIVDPLAKQVISSARDEVFAQNTCKDNYGTGSCCFKKPEFGIAQPVSNGIAPIDPFHLNVSSNQLKQPHTGVACLYPWRWAEEQSPVHNLHYWHPLRHAAIVAIESSAARDRRIFPSVGNIEEKYWELDDKKSWTSSPAKRQRTVTENVSFLNKI